MLDADIVIVGYGPVGATLANLLGVAGLSVAILERHKEPYTLPRATHIDGEGMRVLQAAGLAEVVAPTLGLHPRMRFINAAGELLLDWPRPIEPGPLGWRDNNRFHQPVLESILRRGVARFPQHRVLDGCEFMDARPAGESVVVRYRNNTSGDGVLRASYVIGCDGANSAVRELLGADMDELARPELWLVVDVLLQESAPKLGEGTVQHCDPRRPITSIECVGNRHRWEIMLLPGDSASSFAEPANVWRLLSPWIRPGQAQLERAVIYTFRAAVADRWRRGRILIAGDAAHQTPPFLGQGLCAGIRDAANLAWKLAWVIRGKADDSLLDTYEQEQSPHVRAYIGEAVRIGRIIQVTDPEAAAQRDSELVASPQMLRSIRPSLGAGLHAAPAPAGTLSEQPVLSTGRRMDDVVGLKFAVLGARPVIDGVSAETRELWRRADAVILPDEGASYLAKLGCDAVIVRPDRYLLAGARGTAELDAVSQLIPVRDTRPPVAARLFR